MTKRPRIPWSQAITDDVGRMLERADVEPGLSPPQHCIDLVSLAEALDFYGLRIDRSRRISDHGFPADADVRRPCPVCRRGLAAHSPWPTLEGITLRDSHVTPAADDGDLSTRDSQGSG